MSELVDSIKVIADGLNEINFRLSNLSVITEEFKKLKVEKIKVRDKFEFLVDFFFENSKKRFIEADSQLIIIIEDMKKTLNDLANFQKTIDNVRRFVTAIDTFIAAILI